MKRTPGIRMLLAEAAACKRCQEAWQCADCYNWVQANRGWCPDCSPERKRQRMSPRYVIDSHLEHVLP